MIEKLQPNEMELNPDQLSNSFKNAFAPDQLTPTMRDMIKDDLVSSSKEHIMDSLVKKELKPLIQEELSEKIVDNYITANQNIKFTKNPDDILKKGERFHIEILTGGENDLRELFKPGGRIEEQFSGRPDKSAVFVSKDFRHLPLEDQQDIRKRMRDENVVIVPELPENSVLDKCYERASHQMEQESQKGKRETEEIVESNGPKDQKFDRNKNKPLEANGDQCCEESDFNKGDAGTKGRKPTPDAVSFNVLEKIKIYWEDKRPSECKPGGNSWLSTYRNDPIAETRIKAKDDYEKGKITKEDAEARAIIAEHDDHYEKKGERWNDPDGVPQTGMKEKLGIRLPDNEDNQGRISSLVKELKGSGRNPETKNENGIVYITYDTKK